MKLTIKDGRDHFYTFDTNRILILTASDEENIRQVEFSTEENGEEVSWTSDVLTGSDGIKYVQVPNEFLNGDYTRLVCYYVALDSNGEYTRQKEIFRIRARQEPEDYFLTYSERVTFASIKALTEQYKASAFESMNAAKTSETNAENSADLSRRYAEEAEDVEVETGKYSSKHWSIKTQKKFDEVKEYVGSSSEPTSALGSIETARVKAINDVGTKKDNSIAEIDTHVTEVAVPAIDEYVDKTANPEVLRYGKEQVDSYINGTSKPELDRYVNSDKKTVLDQYTENEKKKVLDQYTEEKKGELDSYTDTDKKKVLDDYVNNVKKVELNTYTNDKKSELDAYKTTKADELNEHTVSLKGSLNGYTTAKKEEISVYTEQKKAEISKVYQTDLSAIDTRVATLEKCSLVYRNNRIYINVTEETV